MKVEILHDSKYGNGAKVAEEIRRLMTLGGHSANVHHIDDMNVKEVPPADLYVLGSPTHFGKATGSMVRFVKRLSLPPGTKYAVFATCSAARPDKKTGLLPSEEETEKLRRTIPMIDEQLQTKGMVKVAEAKFFVDPERMKGPLLDGWQERAGTFVAQIVRQA